MLREETGIAVRLNGDGKGGDFRVVDNSDGHRYDAFVDEELAGHIYRIRVGEMSIHSQNCVRGLGEVFRTGRPKSAAGA